jgi:hypothetical protein
MIEYRNSIETGSNPVLTTKILGPVRNRVMSEGLPTLFHRSKHSQLGRRSVRVRWKVMNDG